MLVSETSKQVVEPTVPSEGQIMEEKRFRRQGWSTQCGPLEVDWRGFIAHTLCKVYSIRHQRCTGEKPSYPAQRLMKRPRNSPPNYMRNIAWTSQLLVGCNIKPHKHRLEKLTTKTFSNKNEMFALEEFSSVHVYLQTALCNTGITKDPVTQIAPSGSSFGVCQKSIIVTQLRCGKRFRGWMRDQVFQRI